MQGINPGALPVLVANKVTECARYLGRKVIELPATLLDIWKNHKGWVIAAIVAGVALICFWEVGLVICALLGGFKLGGMVSPLLSQTEWGYKAHRWCHGFQNKYSPYMVVVALVALSLAAHYFIATCVVNGVIGFIKGAGERYVGGGHGGGGFGGGGQAADHSDSDSSTEDD